jgi:hypothetical protein
MSKQIKNIHTEMVRLFVRKNGVDKQVDIPPGHSIVVEDHMTPTMRVFEKRSFITIGEAQLYESDSFHLLNDKGEGIDTIDEYKTIDEDIDPNNDEPMDHFHTTETHEVSTIDIEKPLEELKKYKEELLKNLTQEENPSRFEVIEGEVEQYVEDGYIKGEWTDEDVEFLKKNYPTKGRKYCSTQLNRNESSVQKKINALGLKKKKKRKR